MRILFANKHSISRQRLSYYYTLNTINCKGCFFNNYMPTSYVNSKVENVIIVFSRKYNTYYIICTYCAYKLILLDNWIGVPMYLFKYELWGDNTKRTICIFVKIELYIETYVWNGGGSIGIIRLGKNVLFLIQ